MLRVSISSGLQGAIIPFDICILSTLYFLVFFITTCGPRTKNPVKDSITSICSFVVSNAKIIFERGLRRIR